MLGMDMTSEEYINAAVPVVTEEAGAGHPLKTNNNNVQENSDGSLDAFHNAMDVASHETFVMPAEEVKKIEEVKKVTPAPIQTEEVVNTAEEHQEAVHNNSAPASATVESVEKPAEVMSALVKEQLKTCSFILKGLKRHPQAGPFQVPVDPIALGIPDYPTVITNPMDLSTIQRKSDSMLYETADQFAADVRLMLNNCFVYNKPETQVYGMGKQVEKYFNSSFAKLPLAPSATQQDDFGKRRKSESIPVSPRHKREVGTPRRTSMAPASMTAMARTKRATPEMNYCMATWRELTKKSSLAVSWPFTEPVNHVALNIPDYPTIVPHPMDLSTMKKKLDLGQYGSPEEFEADFRLMVNNCYTYNGAESEVSKLGRQLEQIFDRKWDARPIPGMASVGRFDEYDDDSEKILALNKQIQALQQELNELLTKRRTSTQHAPKPASAKPRQKSAAPQVPGPNVPMTFEEKRQLSVDVNNLSPEKLGKVVEIIHSNMPLLQQQSGESDVIELDIESLDVKTLRQLQKYISECKSAAVKKRKASTSTRPKKQASTVGATEASNAPALQEAISSDDSSSSDDDDLA